MLTGEIRSKVDQVWNAFWAGGIGDTLYEVERNYSPGTMRSLDDVQNSEENEAGNTHALVGFGDPPART